MAETLNSENAAFWLPSSFLSDDDFLSDDLHNHNNDEFLFPNSCFGFQPLSPVSSTETERGDSINNDDHLFVADFSRQISLQNSAPEKPWNFSTSPQSTLTGFGPWTSRSGFSSNGSPNKPSSQVPSPPLTPPAKNDAAWELLYEAAGQVARLKINALAAELNRQNNLNNHQQNRGLLGAPRNVSLSSKPLHHHCNYSHDFPQYEQVKRQGNGNFYCNHNHNQQRRGPPGPPGPPPGLPHTAWPPLRPNHHHNLHNHRNQNSVSGVRSGFPNGLGPGPMPGIKRQSTGTGVFLPRRATTQQQLQLQLQQPLPEVRKKPTGCSSMWLPARAVDALNMEFEEVNVNNPRNNRFGSAGLLSEQEMIIGRRNAVMEQQKRNMMRNDEIRLPSDWTY